MTTVVTTAVLTQPPSRRRVIGNNPARCADLRPTVASSATTLPAAPISRSAFPKLVPAGTSANQPGGAGLRPA